MYKKLVLILCIVGLFAIGKAVSYEYLLYFGFSDIEQLGLLSIAYYGQYKKMPYTISQLKETDAFKESGEDLERYAEYGTELKRISDNKIEITLVNVQDKEITNYLAVHEISGEEQLLTYFRNGKVIYGFRYNKEGGYLGYGNKNTGEVVNKNISFSLWTSGYDEIEHLTNFSYIYYKKYGRLPGSLPQLEKISSSKSKDFGSFERYAEYDTKLKKISDDKIEITLTYGKNHNKYIALHEIHNGEQVFSYFRNGELVYGCKYDINDTIIAVFDKTGPRPLDFIPDIALKCGFPAE